MVAREEGLVLPERAEGLPEPGHASGLRCWSRHGLEASRQQGEQSWVAIRKAPQPRVVANRSAAHLRKVFISNHWTWQASHDARRTRVSSSFAMRVPFALDRPYLPSAVRS